ncbi:MAG: hypothetical protein GX663_04635 [Clostridiales bacterium]|nr:hypothetical protein [Clostridiales bacterium]
MSLEYKGTIKSNFFKGEAQLFVEEDSLRMDWLFDNEVIPYNHINEIYLNDYKVVLDCREGNIEISRLGHSCDWFFKELGEVYNKKTLTAMSVKEEPLFRGRGNYAYEGKNGSCVLEIFEDAFCILSEDAGGRRVPFVFINGMVNQDYSLTFTLSTGESYRLFMMGRDFDPFEREIKSGIRELQVRNKAFVKDLCNDLLGQELEMCGRLLPDGIAVSLQEIEEKIPALSTVLKGKIGNSKMKETFRVMMGVCDGSQTAVGINRLSEEDFNKLVESLENERAENAQAEGVQGAGEGAIELTEEELDALRWKIWAAVPSKDGSKAIVEFAFPDEAAATYVFEVKETWNSFLTVLNRGMEAVSLAREVISLSDEELAGEKYANYQIAISRTPALAQLRSAYEGKIIHRSLQSWQEGLLKTLG